MSKHKKKLIIIDGNAIIHRSFHALPPTLRTKDGLMVNAVYGFASFLLKALAEFKPDFIILTLDKAGPTFRHEAYDQYKATRTKAPDELYEQIPLVRQVAEAFDIPIFELSGFEADDLIGTLALQAKTQKDLETIIMTGDMDTLQLVDQQINVYTMSRGLSESVLYDENKVEERYGLKPQQIIDYKALRGDPSDNIPGVRGIGEKTAVELLQKFKTLENIYQKLKDAQLDIKPRTIELLKTYEKEAFMSQELATINCQAPIKLLLEQASFNSFDTNKVFQLFSTFEFRSLLSKLQDISSLFNKGEKTREQLDIQPNKTSTQKQKTDYQIIETEKDIEKFVKQLEKVKKITLWPVKAESNHATKLIGMAISLKDGQASFLFANEENLKKIKPILENEKIKKSGHDIKSLWRLLYKNKIKLNGLSFDCQIAAYLLAPGNRRLDFSSLVFSELGQEMLGDNKKSSQPTLNFYEPDKEASGFEACVNADLINKLEPKLLSRLQLEKLESVFNEIEMPLIPVLGLMEEHGIILDQKILEKASIKAQKKLTNLTKEIHELAGATFNVSSTKQLKEVLFENLEIPTTGIKKNKTGFSTAEEELEKIKNFHPIIPLIQEYREISKLENTYLSALPKLQNPNDRKIHSNFNQTITATGRLSSTEPNLQNIPTRTEEGKEIRRAFVASPGFKLVGFDYSQIELRVAAHLSKDEKMIAAFKSGADIHAATAAAINNLNIEEISKQMRQEAKATNFGILYGQGPHGLSQSAGISYLEAKQFIKKYFTAYPGIKKMIAGFIEEAINQGYVSTMFGRRRHLPDINSSIAAVKRGAERMAINTPIQGTAADLIKIAMINIAKMIGNKETEVRLLLQVHDELIFEIKEELVDKYIKLITPAMEKAAKLSVPILVEVNIGDNWSELK